MACARLDQPVSPLDSQEQWPSPMPTSTPALIQEPDQHEHTDSSQHTLVYNESVEQDGHPLSQLDLCKDGGERPPLFHFYPDKQSLKSKTKLILKGWWLEIVMLTLSILLFIAIVIILQKYDKRPMPSWSFNLNVNSLVAFLSTFLRSSLFMILGQGLLNITGHLSRPANESIYSNKSTEVDLAYSSSPSSASTIL
jgi:Protein of unknown function (DUF3176)